MYSPPLYSASMKHNVAIALGSNIGDAAANVQSAFKRLAPLLDNARLSKLYSSAPMYHTDQDQFVNAVAFGSSDITPTDLLNKLKNIEKELGRNETFRNGPRVIDLDVLFYGAVMMQSENLQIPHPRMDERPFVLIPLRELCPDWPHPRTGRTVAQMCERLHWDPRDLHELA